MRKAALIPLIWLALAGAARAERPPVVVELFTAQGCEACTGANELVGKLAARKGVLPLTFSVDYWDYTGWTDTFAKAEFVERQKAYVDKLGLDEPYTPQVVVDGRAQAPGVQADKVERLLREASRAPRDPPDIAFIGARRADVGSGRPPKGGAEVWLIRYDPRERDVEVKAGDNRGKTVTHRNLVREVHKLGAWRGRPTAYRLPKSAEEGLDSVIVVQGAGGGRILAAEQKH
ncbi:MAG: DUF1223 domain-containing protein [Phenylobacterium sp.]